MRTPDGKMAKLNPALHGKRLIAAARFARWEAQVVTATRKVLDRHRAHALANLGHASPLIATSYRPTVGEGVECLVASVHADVFNSSTWGDEVDDEVTPVVSGIMGEVTSTLAAQFFANPGELPDIDVESRVQRLVGKIADLGPQTADRLGMTLMQGTNEGEAIPALAARVSAVFDRTGYAAERVARTEVVGASNALSFDFAQAANSSPDLTLQKTWLSTADERTRGAGPHDEFDHISADGETVGMDEPFVETGEELMYPGDENGSPGNIINCRCTPIFDVEGTTYGDDLHLDPSGDATDDGESDGGESDGGDGDMGSADATDSGSDGGGGFAALSADELTSGWSSWADGLSDGDVASLQKYQGWPLVNQSLRAGTLDTASPDLTTEVSNLDRIIGSASTPRDTTVYRGVFDTEGWLGGAVDESAIGRQFVDSGFMSTTADEALAQAWISNGVLGGAVLEIELPEGFAAASLSAADPELAMNKLQKEVLLQRNVKWEIANVESRGVNAITTITIRPV